MALVLTITQKCTVSIQPVDARGNAAQVDGTPNWGSSDPSIVAVEPAADGLSAVVRAAGPTGTAQVNVTVDARLGPEVKEIVGTLDVEVKGGEAVTVTLNAGTPEEQ